MSEYTYRVDDGDALVVVVHTSLKLESVYDHLVRTGIYNLIKSAGLPTTVDQAVIDEFMEELK